MPSRSFDFVLADPLNNIRRNMSRADSACFVLMKDDMTFLVKFFGDVMQPGIHGRTFCSDAHFSFDGRSQLSGRGVYVHGYTWREIDKSENGVWHRREESLLSLWKVCVHAAPFRCGSYHINMSDRASLLRRTGFDSGTLRAGTNKKVAALFS